MTTTEWLFHQKDAELRLSLCRLAATFAINVVLWSLPSSEFFAQFESLLYDGPRLCLWIVNGRNLIAWRVLASVLVSLWGMGIGGRAVGIAATCSYAVVSWYVAMFASDIWNYNTHLLFFIAMISCVNTTGCNSFGALLLRRRIGTPSCNESLSFVLAFVQSYVILVYFQAGVSKIIYGGAEWAFSGQTLMIYALRFNPHVGDVLLEMPWLAKMASAITVVGEVGIPFAFMGLWKSRGVLAGAMICFHLLIYIVLGISFWHLWIFYPAIFMSWWMPMVKCEAQTISDQSAM